MIVQMKLFAAARQAAGRDTVALELPAGATVGQLRAKLLEAVPALAPIGGHLMFAVNQRYASDEEPLDADAEIACIPPVSGG